MAIAQYVTLRKIATAAGVHVSTVSLALRDDPSLRPATRLRIQGIARQLGHVGSRVTGSLANYRSRSSTGKERPKIAWITHHSTAAGWKKLKTALEANLGAQECAEALGYQLRSFWATAPNLSLARATRMLRTKKFMGLLIAPAPKPLHHLPLPWDDYPAVGIGPSLASPVLHQISNHHYRSAKLAVREVVRRGYRRIGLVLLARAHERVEHGWLAGTLVMAGDGHVTLPSLILPRWDSRLIRRWHQQHRPDVIITRHYQILPTLSALNISVPDDVGVAFLSVRDPTGESAGINQSAHAVGAGAMATVADMITRGEKGVPRAPRRLLFEGTWVDGRTLRSLPPAEETATQPTGSVDFKRLT